MTTGRINQVACRAARDAPIPGAKRARPAAPPTERRSGAKHARSDAPEQMGASPHARFAPNRAGCSTCVRSVFNGLGSHARPLPRESSRARRRNQRRRAPRERSAAGRRTESPLRPAEHPLATRGAQHTDSCDAGPSAHRAGKGVNPSNEAGAHRSNSAKHDPGCGRAVGHAVQGHPHCNPVEGRGADARCTRWLAPDACEQSRNHSHNSKKCLGTRAPGSNSSIGTGRARPPRLPKHRATRCRAPRASCCPLDTLGAPEAGRARCGSPPSLAPLGARARPVCHEYAGADSLGRARCSPATGSDRAP